MPKDYGQAMSYSLVACHFYFGVEICRKEYKAGLTDIV